MTHGMMQLYTKENNVTVIFANIVYCEFYENLVTILLYMYSLLLKQFSYNFIKKKERERQREKEGYF